LVQGPTDEAVGIGLACVFAALATIPSLAFGRTMATDVLFAVLVTTLPQLIREEHP
jgi:hypothetical protein